MVFDGPSRVIDVGVARRLFTGATRRAIEVETGSASTGCDEPASECEIDHVQPWSAGGLTTTANGRPPVPTTTDAAIHAVTGDGIDDGSRLLRPEAVA